MLSYGALLEKSTGQNFIVSSAAHLGLYECIRAFDTPLDVVLAAKESNDYSGSYHHKLPL